MTRRLISYVLAAVVAALLVTTISAEWLVSYQSIPSVVLFALLLGLLDAAVAPTLARLPAVAGCWPFAFITFGLNVVLFWLAGSIVPGMTVSLAGAVVGAAIATAAAAAMFTLLDERFANG